jgi:peptidyl-prolyl cis-trans isomerase D
MLQKLRESTGRWIAVGLLGLIAITFIFFGIDFSTVGATFAAKVNGETIPLTEFERELQQTQNQYQQQFPVELTDELRRELRRQVIERMVLSTALEQRADEMGYRVSDERLAESIRQIAAFRPSGEFSPELYSALLAQQGLTPRGFEELQRTQLELGQLENGIAGSAFLTPAEYRRYIELFNERRELAYAVFSVDDFLPKVEIGDDAIAAHYEENGPRYMSPETVDLEYIELDQASIAATVEVTDAALREYYEQEKDRFQTPEERHARHILVTVEDDDEAAAEAKARALLARVQGGEDFAAVAAEASDDAGTKGAGGDLGWIGRGMLAGPFEDTLFSMQAGEVAGPVRSDFGYHIIELEEIRQESQRSFEDVRDELAPEYQSAQADQRFYDAANRLADLAFDAYDELDSVAEELNLPVETIDGFSRGGNPAFANPMPIVQSAFSEELVDSGRNSALIELGDDDVVVLRVKAHHLPERMPLEQVSDEIRMELSRQAAEKLVDEAAMAFDAELESGVEDPAATAEAHGGTWTEKRWVERTDPNVPRDLLGVVFGVLKPLPENGMRQVVPLSTGDEAVMIVTGVEPGQPDTVAREQRDQRQRQLSDESSRSEMNGYAAEVRDSASVRIPEDVLTPTF